MRFKDHLSGEVAVFEMSGKMMGGLDATRFHGRIREYINLNKNRVLLDLQRVGWANSRGLGMLLSARAAVRDSGGWLALANIDGIESLLTMTKLVMHFEHFDSRDAAMRALGGR